MKTQSSQIAISSQSNRKKAKFRRARPKLDLSAKIGLAIIVANLLIVVIGPLFAPHSPNDIISDTIFAQPGEVGLLGTDSLGRDLFSRMLYGARTTIGLSFIATVIGFVIGMALGFTAAEAGQWVDDTISRFVDIMISFPPMLLALIVIAGLGSSMLVLVCTVGITHASRVARVSRAIAMEIAINEFVEVARARGESLISILRREIWPNSIRPLAAEFGLRYTYSILFLSGLSFLGLGIQPPAADWGMMVKENLAGLYYGAWAALLPAAAISIITVGINLIVDWLGAQTGKQISEEMIK
jgi:peptide/nickel transport system permease protein